MARTNIHIVVVGVPTIRTDRANIHERSVSAGRIAIRHRPARTKTERGRTDDYFRFDLRGACRRKLARLFPLLASPPIRVETSFLHFLTFRPWRAFDKQRCNGVDGNARGVYSARTNRSGDSVGIVVKKKT